MVRSREIQFRSHWLSKIKRVTREIFESLIINFQFKLNKLKHLNIQLLNVTAGQRFESFDTFGARTKILLSGLPICFWSALSVCSLLKLCFSV